MAPRTKDWWERFFPKIDFQQRCWVWIGALNNKGYGQFFLEGRLELAHRVAYLKLVGPIEEDREVDHLCRVRACVNPSHLEAVTHRVNLQRGDWSEHANRWGGRCTKGHDMVVQPNGHRVCRVCAAARLRAYRAKKKEK